MHNTPFTTKRTHIEFGTEKLDDFNALKLYHTNIVYTDRSNIEDMIAVPNTLKISQVNGEVNPITEHPHQQWKLTTSLIPCSCPSCMRHPSCGACVYKEERGEVAIVVTKKRERDVTQDDEFGVSTMSVKQLKIELKERNLRLSGLKAELAARLLLHLSSEAAGSSEASESSEASGASNGLLEAGVALEAGGVLEAGGSLEASVSLEAADPSEAGGSLEASGSSEDGESSAAGASGADGASEASVSSVDGGVLEAGGTPEVSGL